jgi:hypothetical protein
MERYMPVAINLKLFAKRGLMDLRGAQFGKK